MIWYKHGVFTESVGDGRVCEVGEERVGCNGAIGIGQDDGSGRDVSYQRF